MEDKETLYEISIDFWTNYDKVWQPKQKGAFK